MPMRGLRLLRAHDKRPAAAAFRYTTTLPTCFASALPRAPRCHNNGTRSARIADGVCAGQHNTTPHAQRAGRQLLWLTYFARQPFIYTPFHHWKTSFVVTKSAHYHARSRVRRSPPRQSRYRLKSRARQRCVGFGATAAQHRFRRAPPARAPSCLYAKAFLAAF